MTVTLGGIGFISAGDKHHVVLPRNYRPDVNPVILCFHGHGGDSNAFLDVAPDWWLGQAIDALADAGYAILTIDAGGPVTWIGDTALSRANAAWAWTGQAPGANGIGLGGLGRTSTVVGVMGWSMGGGLALEWSQRNPQYTAATWCWTPVTDLDWAKTVNGTWATEINAAHGGSNAAYNVSKLTHSPIHHVADFRGKKPVQIVHAVNDSTIPIQKTRDFVAAVADPLVQLLEVPAGDHTALFNYVAPDAPARFYAAAGLHP